MPILIEKPNLTDLADLLKLEKACFPLDAWPLLDLIGVLTMPDLLRLKAVADGRMAGFAAAEHDPTRPITWIMTIGVHPEYQRRGIGDMLLLALEDQVKTPELRLTGRRSNQPAINMYHKHGYRQLEVWTKYYEGGEDGLVMARQKTVTPKSSEG